MGHILLLFSTVAAIFTHSAISLTTDNFEFSEGGSGQITDVQDVVSSTEELSSTFLNVSSNDLLRNNSDNVNSGATMSNFNVKNKSNSPASNEDGDITENTSIANTNCTAHPDYGDDDDSFNVLVNGTDVEQADSPNATASEETFERVFNISPEDSDLVNQQADQQQDQSNEVPQSLDNVFEVYRFSNKPNSNVTNEGNKTLAEHIEEIFFNRLPTEGNVENNSDTSAPEDDISDVEPIYIRRGDIDRDEEYGDEYEETRDNTEEENEMPTQAPEEEVEKTQSGTSLAIVFDITGSMHDDLLQVRKGAERIMAAMLERADKPIYNYVLVPFHDPKIGPVTVTTDHEAFRESLQRVVVHGGGDCPEMALGAIKLALEASLPNSFIYVFTDASAKDYNIINEVLSLVQRKQSQVVFVMTGDCGDRKHIQYHVFERIAATSSGQIYSLNKTDVEKVLQFVRTSLDTRKVNLLSVNKPGPSREKHNVFVDETLHEITVSVSGQNPQIDILDPRGRSVDGPPQLNTVLNLPNIKAVNIIEPEPGRWTVKVGSDSEHSVRSTGRSDIDFVFGFSAIPTNKMEETYHRPLKGDKNSILVQPTQQNVVHNLTTLKLVDLKGNEFQQHPLVPVPGKPGLYQMPEFVPPNDYFYLGVEGFDNDGFPVKRISPTAITGQSPEPPVVNMKPHVTGWLNKPVKLRCHIESLVPFYAMWFKDGVPLTTREKYQQTTELTWVVQNPTVGSEGNYTCYTNNVAGSSTKGTWLTITGPAPQIDIPPQVVSAPNKDAALDCTVRSQLRYNVTWARSSLDTSVLPEPDSIQLIQNNDKTMVLPNGTLIVNSVTPEDAGWYSCIAQNKGGKNEGHVYLAVKEPIHVAVAPEKFEFQQGDSINLSCQATGTPEPTFVWKKNGQVLKEGNGRDLQLRQHYRRLDLFMENAVSSDAGKYHCVAENDNDVDVGVSTGEYMEPPTIRTTDNDTVLVRVGLPATLKCIATGSPTPVIRWFKDNNEVLSSSKYKMEQDGTLIISNAQATDSGPYTCVAGNRLGVFEYPVMLYVGAPPQMIQIPKDVQIDIYNNGSLPCIAIGTPTPKVSWMRKDGKQLNQSNVRITEHGNLLITHAAKEDAGSYICKVTNTFGHNEHEAQVQITGIVKPVLRNKNGNHPETTVKRGMLVEMPCQVILSNPPAVISWYKDGEILDEEQMQWEGITVLINGSLIISYTTQEHEGTYECIASNVGGSVSLATTLRVLESPSFPPAATVEFKVHAGEEAVLPCPVLGIPDPVVVWKKDEMPLSLNHIIHTNNDDNSLVISSATVADSGTYECTAINAAGEAKRAMALFIQVPPYITPGEEHVNAVDGQLVTLTCEVEAVPAAVILWYKDEAPLSSYEDKIMYLNNNATIRFVANFGSSGIYRCEAMNDAGSAKMDVSLLVLVPPSIYPAQDEIHVVNISQSVSLNCFVSGYPTPLIMWQRNGAEITDDSHMSVNEDGILDISNVQPNMSGVYACDVENAAGIVQKMFYLVVHVPPSIEADFPTQIKLMEGDDYSIPCNAHGIPNPHVSWRRDGQAITEQDNEYLIVLEDGTLVIHSAQLDTTGIYTCVAENTKGSDERHFLVEVMVPPSMMDSGETRQQVIEGDSVVIACPAKDAVPPPNIEWLKDGNPLNLITNERSDQVHFSLQDGGRSIFIEETHASDNGTYLCIATNPAGRINAEIKLDVLLAPNFEETNHKHENTVVAGSEVKFECNVSGNPEPRISWKKNNLPITPHTAPGVMLTSNKQSLIIPNVRLHDSGNYQCSVINRAGRKDRDFQLSVLIPPDLDGPVEELQEAVKGEPVLLQCPITGQPNPYIKWSKDGLDIIFNKTNAIILSNDQRILEISKVQPNDAGIYTCTGSNQAASKQKNFNVTVYEPPVMHQQQLVEEIKARVGDNVSMTCTTRGHPKPDVKWLHKGHILENATTSSASNTIGERASVEQHSLTLKNIAISDAGKYTCLASNVAGVSEKNYRLKVQAAPKLAVHKEDKNVIESLEGLPIIIKCPVVGTSNYDIHWMKNSEPLETKDTMKTEALGQMLRIKNSRQEHAGNYTCVVQNNAGNVSKNFQLNVLVPPVMADMGELNNIRITSNDTLVLQCNVTGGYPHPNIAWYKGSMPITKDKWQQITLGDYNRTLIVPNVSTKHSGKYSCLASNMAGDTEQSFNVEVEEPPEAGPDVPDRSNLTVQLHRRLVLKCPLTGSPQPKITWYKEGVSVQKQLGNNIHVSSDGKQLHLMHALLNNSGNYSCVAENSAGAKELLFQVDVQVPAEWGSWSSWSDCSVTCGPGEQYRVRVCGEDVDETNCQGESEEMQSCHMSECPVDGAWSEWSDWTSCSVSCGRGTRRRYRKCNNPVPTYGGKPCIGADGQQAYCNQSTCPVNGKWSEWSNWSPCSATCNNGTQIRYRKCNNPPPAFGGKECNGSDRENKECNSYKCPVNGQWSSWTEWSSCSVTCGHGSKRRYRSCTNPPPQFKGAPCKGENLQIEKCMARSCGNVPLAASLRVKGHLNGENIPEDIIAANISDRGPRRTVSARVKDIIKQQAGWFPYLPFILSPVSWNTAYEVDEANNGYSLTNGNFRQQSQIEFATGQELFVTHVGRGIDETGALKVEIEVNGEVPLVQPEASISIEPFEEDYVQTSPNSLYTYSTNNMNVNGHKLPYSWNNTVSYDTYQGTMPYLVEKLSTRDIDIEYDPDMQEMTYMMSTAIARRFDNDQCPEGFIRDEQHLHCRDIDECHERRTNRCHYTQICENLFGSYRCFCHPGYKSRGIGKRCLDINECAENPSVCSHQCRNVKGSYKCVCSRGYVLLEDGRTCSGLQYWNEYTNPDTHDVNFHPQNTNGLRSLQPTYRQNTYYQPLDEGLPSQPYITLEETWNCPQGFEPSNGLCQDIDECVTSPQVCTIDQTCINIKGSHRCLETPCPTGYERDSESRNCIQFCDEPEVKCKEGALLTQTISHVVLHLENKEVQPYQDLMQLTVYGEDGRHLPRTRFRIVENEAGKPFRVRIENGQGILYTLKSLKLGRLYRIIVLALSYDENEYNILYTTKYIIFINLIDDS